jgi:predicted CopG family antitoxin
MTGKYENFILNKLLDKYEKSKSFTGDNKVNQRFSVKISYLIPQYLEHSNFGVFQAVNDAIDTLQRRRFVIAKANKANVYNDIVLNIVEIGRVYEYLDRTSKKEINEVLKNLLEQYEERNEVLNRYCRSQFQRLALNKSVQFFNDDLREFENILMAIEELLKVENETFVRDFSVKVFKDSKIFDGISSKVINLLYEYGDYPENEREQILGALNIIKNPTYVNFKGAGRITIKGQIIDFSKLSNDIAISSAGLADIEKIEALENSVITIENLTTFHTFNDYSKFVIYLGGYHNRVRSEFIKKIMQQNPDVIFYHFGDIDAGGFYILEHLKRQTGIDFKPYKMDIDTLKNFSKYLKKLTDNDYKRLLRLKTKSDKFEEVICYMLENNCKLEQEAINAERREFS